MSFLCDGARHGNTRGESGCQRKSAVNLFTTGFDDLPVVHHITAGQKAFHQCVMRMNGGRQGKVPNYSQLFSRHDALLRGTEIKARNGFIQNQQLRFDANADALKAVVNCRALVIEIDLLQYSLRAIVRFFAYRRSYAPVLREPRY